MFGRLAQNGNKVAELVVRDVPADEDADTMAVGTLGQRRRCRPNGFNGHLFPLHGLAFALSRDAYFRHGLILRWFLNFVNKIVYYFRWGLYTGRMPVDRIKIASGVSMPFFPMRPWHGLALDSAERVKAVSAMRKTHVLDRKLNGDRVTIGKTEKLYVANRHGSWYSFGVENRHLLENLPPGTVLDGEVWKKNFYPFDVLAFNGSNTCFTAVEDRRKFVKQLCESLGIKWMWDVEDEWMEKLAKNAPTWEGVVAKKLGSSYIMLGSEARTSDSWSKNKWTV